MVVCFTCVTGIISYSMRIEAVTVLTVMVTVIWVVTPYNIVFTSGLGNLLPPPWIWRQKFLWNADRFLPDYMTSRSENTLYPLFFTNVLPQNKAGKQSTLSHLNYLWYHSCGQRNIFCVIIKIFYTQLFWYSNLCQETNISVRISTILPLFGCMWVFHVPSAATRNIHQKIRSWIIQRQGIQNNGNTWRIFWKLLPAKFLDVAKILNACMQLEGQYF